MKWPLRKAAEPPSRSPPIAADSDPATESPARSPGSAEGQAWLSRAASAICNICGSSASIQVPSEAADVTELRESLPCSECGGISRDRALIVGLAGLLGHQTPLATWPADKNRRMFETTGYRGHPRYLPEIFEYFNLPYVPPPEDESGEAIDARVGADIQDLQFPAGFFDIVQTAEVLEHVPDEQKAIAEIARVLKPGGHLVLEVPYAHYLEQNLVRVNRWHGRDVFLYPPEYHAEHTLVYRIYGRQLLDDLATAGLAVSVLRLDIPELAITPQFVIVAMKGSYIDMSGFRFSSYVAPQPIDELSEPASSHLD